MKGIIVYQSKYGSTKKYASWISDKTGFECVELKKTNISYVKNFDTIILGGGIYASGISGLSFLKKYYNDLQEKKIIVFCVGASPYEESTFREIIKHNMNDDLSQIPCYYCRGAWDMDNMSFFDRNLCTFLRKAVSKKDEKDYAVWERALIAAGDSKCDWCDQRYIEPILEELMR